jgi:integrase
MFRDTFAVELLLAGVPLDQVSLLLGHSSVKITERHYALFCKARQEQLAARETSLEEIETGCSGAVEVNQQDYACMNS